MLPYAPIAGELKTFILACKGDFILIVKEKTIPILLKGPCFAKRIHMAAVSTS